MKTCTRCKTAKSLDEFPNRSRELDGLHYWCRTCKCSYENERYHANPEPHREKVRAARAANPVYLYPIDREDPERLARRYAAVLKRQYKLSQSEPIPREEIWKRDKCICGICLEPIEGEYHIDHIQPLSKGGQHVRENVQLAHPPCNLAKAATWKPLPTNKLAPALDVISQERSSHGALLQSLE